MFLVYETTSMGLNETFSHSIAVILPTLLSREHPIWLRCGRGQRYKSLSAKQFG